VPSLQYFSETGIFEKTFPLTRSWLRANAMRSPARMNASRRIAFASLGTSGSCIIRIAARQYGQP
jgi:hypothetical protein